MTPARDTAAPSGELKPCPFCGETPDVNDPATFQMNQGTKWGFVVCCCNGPEVRTEYQPVEHWKAEAIAAWNRRAPDVDAGEEPSATTREGDALDRVAEDAYWNVRDNPQEHARHNRDVATIRAALRTPSAPSEEQS